MKLSLGFSPCPNDTFIFDALVHGRIDCGDMEFDVIMEDVESLNRMALKGRLDITKLSYFAFGHVTAHYILLNSGSALGEKCGPLLVARHDIPADEIRHCLIAIPGELTTANFLFSMEFPDALRKRPMPFHLIEGAVLSGECDAGVIIHENRFTYMDKGLMKICDLGDRWEERTGFPIPLGGIAIKRQLPDSIIRQVDGLVRQSVRHAFAHPADSADYVRRNAQELDESVIRRHIALYVNDYSQDLGTVGREAVEYMLGQAAGLGLVPGLNRPLIV